MRICLVVTVVGFLAIACGSDDSKKESRATAPAPDSPPAPVDPSRHLRAMLVEDATKLPACTAADEGWILYVKAEKALKACASGAWVDVELKSSEPAAPATNSTTGAKLKKGMTKEEVQTAIGAPVSVSSYSTFTDWKMDAKFCEPFSLCELRFNPDGKLETVSGLKPEYLDVTTF